MRPAMCGARSPMLSRSTPPAARRQGIEVLQKVPRGELEDPHEAVYAAVLYADDNQMDVAKEFIAAARAGALPPEERKLLDEVAARTAGNAPLPSATPAPAETAPSPAPDAQASPAGSR